MTDSNRGGLDRRGFVQLAAAGAGLAGDFSAQAVGKPAETLAHTTRQPSPSFASAEQKGFAAAVPRKSGPQYNQRSAPRRRRWLK
jgi:ABC-type sugar transport system substrate-binding protein